MDQPVRTYSSGMKARLGFAINANVNPEILIVDEALSVGDKAFRIKCNEKINEIVGRGVTFLFVTHSTKVAQNFCTRGIVMKSGKFVFDGDIKEAAVFYEKMVDDDIKRRKKIRAKKAGDKLFQPVEENKGKADKAEKSESKEKSENGNEPANPESK